MSSRIETTATVRPPMPAVSSGQDSISAAIPSGLWAQQAGYSQTNLVSNIAGVGNTTDPQLLNPWGISILPGQDFWIANRNGLIYTYPGCLVDTLTVSAQEGGPIALVKDGDIIAIDAEAGTIELEVDPIELENRKRHWAPRVTGYGSGALWKFAQGVGPAHLGAVTHPGMAGERKVYADI